MCDYSLHHVASRPAKVGDKLTTRDFGTGTRGFAASEDSQIAVCVLPGTELAFAKPVECGPTRLLGWGQKSLGHRTAIFRQINKERAAAHHGRVGIPRRSNCTSHRPGARPGGNGASAAGAACDRRRSGEPEACRFRWLSVSANTQRDGRPPGEAAY
jgi:hypothetical protein